MAHRRSQYGFTLIEVMTVMAFSGILAAIAIPVTESAVGAHRLTSDARGIAQELSLAKMRAAARFTHSRLYVDRRAGRHLIQTWDKTGGDWMAEGAPVALSRGVSFSFAGLAAPPPHTQAAIGFSPECRDKDAAVIADTSCVVFNSRGVPIDSAGAPTGGGGFYLTDGALVYGVTITATPMVRVWRSPAAQVAWTAE